MSAAEKADAISHIRKLLGPAVLLRWPSGSKAGRQKWKHLRLTDMTAEYLAKFNRPCNVGVALGQVSDGLVTIDFDDGECANDFLEANPLLRDTLRTGARRGCNIWIRCNGAYPPTRKLKTSSGQEIGEWRSDASQTIIAGIHPEGVPYRFVVERPVTTLRYDAIIWPCSLVAPVSTENKRIRGIREDEVVSAGCPVVCPAGAVAAAESAAECMQIRSFLGSCNSIAQIAPVKEHQNNASLFKLARLLVKYEGAIGRSANDTEKQFVFARWAEGARQFWRPGLDWDDYYAEFLVAYSCARIGLDEDPLEVAVSRARSATLPKAPSGFKGERIRLLIAICRELQTTMGANPIYLPTRKLGEILGAHWTSVASWLRVLEEKRIIQLAPGEVRKRGSERCPRYYYRGALELSQMA